jgi:hypothetical protein
MKFKIFSIQDCSHDFAFPRSTDGRYTQVCRLCGAEYEYDWQEMRRKKRIETTTDKRPYNADSRDRTLPDTAQLNRRILISPASKQAEQEEEHVNEVEIERE